MLVLLVLSFLVSLGLCVLLMVMGRGRARLYGQDMPQRFHVGDVPRFGGLATVTACMVA